MAPDDNQDQEDAEHSCESYKRRFCEQQSTEQCQGHSAQCEPRNYAVVQFPPIEPDTASVSNKLGDGENRYCLADSEGRYKNGKQHGCAAKSGDGGKRGGNQ